MVQVLLLDIGSPQVSQAVTAQANVEVTLPLNTWKQGPNCRQGICHAAVRQAGADSLFASE